MQNLRNKLITGGAVLMLAALGTIMNSHPARTVHAKDGCSLDTLKGSYLVTGRGEAPIGVQDARFPSVTLAVWNFDGQGNMSGFGTFSNGGMIGRRVPVTATYTLDSDCTGTFTFGSGAGWELFVTSDGSEGRTLNLNEGTIGTRSFKRR